MPVTSDQFRAQFPEFEDKAAYADVAVGNWLTYGYTLLNAARWQDSLDYGVQLYTAHQLALGRRRYLAAQRGQMPGQMVGPITSKSVGGVSVGYDTPAALMPDAGPFNQTEYGVEYWQLAQWAGAGAVYIIGPGIVSTSPTGNTC
jgi:hypothetical protein